MKLLFIVRSAGLGKIFCNFRNHPTVLLNVNSKYFCDDAWETLLLFKRKGGWQNFFSFLEKKYFLLRSGLKLIFHCKAHCFILARSLLSSEVVITDSWITEKKESWVSSAKNLELEDKPSAKFLIYIRNNNGTRMEP